MVTRAANVPADRKRHRAWYHVRPMQALQSASKMAGYGVLAILLPLAADLPQAHRILQTRL